MRCEFCGKKGAKKAIWDAMMHPACDECFEKNFEEIEVEEDTF